MVLAIRGCRLSAAYATGVGRILNNRHWASDVWAGAGVSILSAQLGYILSDLIWHKGINLAYERPSSEDLPHTLSLHYTTSYLTQHYYKSSARRAIRNEFSLLFPIPTEEDLLLDGGVVGGHLLQISEFDVPNATDWYFGVRGDISYFPTPRVALGVSPFGYFAPKAPSALGSSLLAELGLRGYLDYDIRPHRSFRLFVGASHTTAYYPISEEHPAYEEGDTLSASPLRLSLEFGVALLLDL